MTAPNKSIFVHVFTVLLLPSFSQLDTEADPGIAALTMNIEMCVESSSSQLVKLQDKTVQLSFPHFVVI